MKSVLIVGPNNKKYKMGNTLAITYTKYALEKINIKVKIINIALGFKKNLVAKFTIKKVILFFVIISSFLKNIIFYKNIYIITSMSTFGFLRDFSFFSLSYIFKKRIILHLHGGGFRENFFNKQNTFIKLLIKLMYSNSDKIFLLSKKFEKDFDNIIKKNNIEIIPNTIPLNFEYPKEIFFKNYDKPKILFVSNLIKSKGYKELILACIELKKKNLDFECIIIGDFIGFNEDIKKSKEEIISLISAYKLNKQIKIYEEATNELKIKSFLNSNIFILPSFYKGEGLPLCLIEAISYSYPLISTNHAAITDILVDGYNGYLIDNNEPLTIVKAIDKVMKNKEKIKLMEKNSYELFQDKYTPEKIYNIIQTKLIN